MNASEINLGGTTLTPRPSGALFWAQASLLCVSDLHLGKSDRIARRSGALLPPYEVQDTLLRLEADIEATQAKTVICLGDSFDDLAACDSLGDDMLSWIARLQSGRQWIWIEGNHDPGPIGLGGSHMAEARMDPLVFRHIASAAGQFEISGHYHPKARIGARGRRITRPCFLVSDTRVIMPAYGTYTGGLWWDAPPLKALIPPNSRAILLGDALHSVPVP